MKRMASHECRWMVRGRARVDLVHQRIQAARRPVAVPSHVDAGAQPARGGDERNILFANDRLAVLAPFVDEFGAALLLDVIVRGDGMGFCAQMPVAEL